MLLITHNGSFHLDEIISTAILKLIYPTACIKRTRDMDEINTGDIVYDVGSTYDPTKLRFDHHQRGFDETIINVKLSSSGLIYRHFYRDLFKIFNVNENHKFFNLIYYEVYDEYFKYADAIDNGINIENVIRQDRFDDNKDFNNEDLNNEYLNNEDLKGNSKDGLNDKESIYKILDISPGNVSKCRIRTLGNIVSTLNNSRNGFKEALKIVKQDLKRYLKNKLEGWATELINADKVFNDYFDKLKEEQKVFDKNSDEVKMNEVINLNEKILVLEKKDHCSLDVLFILNDYYKKDICFVIYKSEKDCRIYSMRVSRFSFETKVPLKEEWRGINGDKLQKLTGLNDANFVHASGFTGGAKSLESAIKMCEMSLKDRK
ncbi:UPF0160 protein MYG1, mitochondrial [Dictyocoela muelleri]|nr:UPF0160 protein MYG1, mitochondrial [Dictyocoela muelleri]